jgi:Na+-translocating ferredoxin:NAD+ oxidoreductase subunit C
MNKLANFFLKGFQHGVHPPEHKESTAGLPMQRIAFMDRYVLPLHQNLGAPPRAVVRVGERVLRGQPVAEPSAFFSTALHSPVTGWIRAVGNRRMAGGHFAAAIEIEADPYATQRLDPQPRPDWRGMTLDQLVVEVQRAGIVGLGGAAFPAHVKYSLPEGRRIRYLLINGAECEPYLTNDHRLMVERPQALLHGIEILHTLLGAEQTVIGVELNKADAIAELRNCIKPDQPIRVQSLRVKYPQGAEKMLIKSVFDREVPTGQLPRDLGILVNNVATVVAIADWFERGQPLIDRPLTVSGSGIAAPANLIVPIGTPVREVLRVCGGLRDDTVEVIMGGPMMGTPVPSLDVPVVKGTSGILAFTDREAVRPPEYPCIRCGRCVEACPYFLNPSKLARLARARLFDEIKTAGVMECVECGSCTYACPSGIPIVQLIRTAKADLRRRKGKS